MNNRQLLTLCAALIACTLAIIGYLHYPQWCLDRENTATRELFTIARLDDPRAALAAWLAAHPDHPRAPSARVDAHVWRDDAAKLRQSLAHHLAHPDAP